MERFPFFKHKIRGRNEFEIYKNYVGDHSSSYVTSVINQRFESQQLKGKDDLKSQQLRKEGNKDYRNGDYKESAVTYTKSLCYATYNSEAYATAFANRSAVFFKFGDYESCIKDIDLCLKANYPEAFRPKMCIRKAECYQKLGDSLKMRTILLDVLNMIDSMEPSLNPIAENYRKTVKELITEEADTKKDETSRFDKLPTLDANPSFLGASTSIELQHTRRRGARVVAKKEIAPGDILFVEKAFAFVYYYETETFPLHCQNCLKIAASCVPHTRRRGARVVAKKEIAPGDILFVEKAFAFVYYYETETFPLHCQNCLKIAASCVPCKGCVEHVYCSEECRDIAWNGFHQWECTAIQAKCFDVKAVGTIIPLSLRILLKGLQTGLPMNSVHFENGVINNYGNIDDNYPYMYSLPTNVNKIKEDFLQICASEAETLVMCLKLKTNFFDHLKKWPAYANKSDKELTNTIGGLLIRYMAQLHCSEIKIPNIEPGVPINRLTVGFAVCPSLAMTTHSCKPNTTHYFLGDTVVVKALENIKPGEEINRAYQGIDHEYIPNPKERQIKLMEECFLNCKCRACTNPKMTFLAHNAYICVKCNGPLLVDWNFGVFAEGTCLDCNYKGSISSEVAIKEKLVSQLMADFKVFNNLEDANRGLQLAKTIYQPSHRVIRDLYVELAKYNLRTGNLKCYVEMQKVVIEYYDKYYGNLSLQSGSIRCTYYFNCLELLKDKARYLQVGEILDDLKIRIDEVKVIMDLHFPPFLEKVAKLEKLILELQITDVTQAVYDMHLDCFCYHHNHHSA